MKKGKNMTVSVVLSTYNGVDYLKEQLDSIRLQERQPDEVLISDDFSTDNTCEFVKKYIKQYDLDWKLISHSKNVGWRINFRRTLLVASGDIIFLCDQDDIWYKSKIKDLSALMEKYQNIDVLASSWETMSDNRDNGKIKPIQETFEISKVQFTENIFKIPYPGCTYCIRTAFVHEVVGYWLDSFPHDAFLWRMANLKGTLYTFGKAEMKWRQHLDSSYAKEKRKSHSNSSKIEWLNYANTSIDVMSQYLRKQKRVNKKILQDILDKNRECINLRKKLYTNGNIFTWIRLIHYIKTYPYKIQYITDLYFFIRNTR